MLTKERKKEHIKARERDILYVAATVLTAFKQEPVE